MQVNNHLISENNETALVETKRTVNVASAVDAVENQESKFKLNDYWSVFTDSSIPVGQRALAGMFLPVALMIQFLGVGCADPTTQDWKNPDEPIDVSDDDTGMDDDDTETGPRSCQNDVGGYLLENTRFDPVTQEDKQICLKFEERHEEAGLEGNINNLIRVKAQDVNQDSFEDLVMFSSDNPMQVFLNNKDGVPGSFEEGDSFSDHVFSNAIWADYDDDGDQDIFAAGIEGLALYMNGTVEVLSKLDRENESTYGAMAWMEQRYHFNSQELVDKGLVLGTDACIRYYRYRPEENDFTADEAHAKGIYDAGQASKISVADYNGDGLNDFLVSNVTGQLGDRLYKAYIADDGAIKYESVEGAAGESQYTEASDMASMDAEWFTYPGSANPYLAVAKYNTGTAIYQNNQDGTFANVTDDWFVQAEGDNMGVEVSDFLGDGTNGFFFCRYNQEPSLLLETDPDHTSSPVYDDFAYLTDMVESGETNDCVCADFNADGYPDCVEVMWSGAVLLYENQTEWGAFY